MKIICVGRNYAKHIEELANEKPENPVLFMKPDTSVLLKKQPFFIPDFSNDVHYEVEVLVRIHKIGKYIQPKFAHKYYNQIGLGIDFTARDLQNELKAKGLPWEKAKGFDGSAVISEKWIDKDNFEDIQQLDFSLQKNGEVVQNANTSLMLWKIDELISYISQFFMLKIGDIIFTGTPSGVGKIQENDILEGYIENQKMFQIKVK
ncbi:fumarylacetoacetate hydrolase family protein [Mesonia sp. K7]|uniref:fumarylacetoacetate hydrolase family protein n=1 Tax=Mesonia sp. K7 TaxID=2218606 RepID=UPI000DA78E91|nr:fumarylacetoacetate hydrolase family protein [Mesonia sp. K7]PZD77280.1 2-hydroxyhepta-2,4-diene-1,7-dioate isomerase [Mesonia sp. K7]